MKTLAAKTPNGTPTIGAVMLINQLGLIGTNRKKVMYQSKSPLCASIDLPVALMRSEQHIIKRRFANVFDNM